MSQSRVQTRTRPRPPTKSTPTAASAAFPVFQPVELATLVDAVPRGEDWLHEVKYDGYRCVLAIGGGEAKAFTRSGLDWSEDFALLSAEAVALIDSSALIDGEAVVLDAEGRSSFRSLQSSLKGGEADLVFFAFDLLAANGQSLTDLPLLERKQRLEKLIGKGSKRIRYSDHIVGNGETLLDLFCKRGLEGVVSKRASSRYVGARTRDWVKTKCMRRQEFVVVGWTPSDKAREFSSLILAVNEAGALRFAGKVGTGFDIAEFARLLKMMTPLARPTPPLDVPRAGTRDAHWIEPRLVAEISFTEMTKEGVLRHPSYLGLREDKEAEGVVMEKPVKAPVVEEPRRVRPVTISNPDRVIFPDAGITKGELADYYVTLAEVMLPWVAERPVSVIRCPQGRAKKCFFQKHDAGTFGEHVKQIAIREKDGSSEPYLFVESIEGLLTCVQMGTIEFHVWGSRVEDVEKADRLVFDLDPDEGLQFKDVQEAAADFRKMLRQAGLETFPMITGGKGVHVIAPLTPRAEWPAVKGFAQSIAEVVSAKDPSRFTSNPLKSARKGRIFVDYLRNARGATAIAPYSARARDKAPVAVPISWAELKAFDSAERFHVGDAATLVKRAKSKALTGWGRADQFLPEL